MTPDLDRLLRIAAAELPPGHRIAIWAGGGWYALWSIEDGSDVYFPSTQDPETVAGDLERLLRDRGLLPTEAEGP